MSNVLQETYRGVELAPMLGNGHKRWKLLSIALRSSRAFSQARKILVKNQDVFFNKFLRSPSYTVVNVEPECFSRINKLRLSKLVQQKNSDHLNQFGGVQALVSELKTHAKKGIQTDAEGVSHRRQAFGSNEIQTPSVKMLQIVLETFKDPILLVLFLSASLSLGFGIKKKGLKGASDGLFIFVSVFLVIAVTSFCNVWPTKQFHILSKSIHNISTSVVRDGRERQISANDAVVGDVVYLQIGDQVPADGLYIDGSSFQVNESVLTKEANSVKIIDSNNPFLLARSKVTNGTARMLVTAVGMNTKWGEMMSSTYPTNYRTPLQVKLHKLSQNIAKVGSIIASMVLMLLLIQYFTRNMKDDSGVVDYTSSKRSIHHVCQAIIGILVTPIVIAATAIPEGLLLAVTITLAYSTKRMAAEKALVRNLSACEAIGSITVICIDRSSTISSNSPKVEQFWLGQNNYSKKWTRSLIAKEVLQLIHEGVGLNATSGSSSDFNELQTKEAVCAWAVQELGMNLEQLKDNCSILDAESLNLQKKQGSICIQRNTDNTIHVHMRGSTDMILAMCSHYYEQNGEIKNITDNAREEFKKIVQEMKDNGINCIGYAHAAVSREFDDNSPDNLFHPKPKEEDLTLIGFLGLKDLFRPNISKALTECQQAGVDVKMITTEDVPKAKASALECGIFSPNQTTTTEDIIEGIEFRNCIDQERLEKVEKFRVIARASTSDKLLLVRCLKHKGHVVAVIGGCPRDEILLGEADVGFYLGNQGSHSVNEKLDIIISDDSFTSIARAMRWGRGIYNNIQILTQFQLTATISSLVTDSVKTIFAGEPSNINIVTAISAGKVPFAALQILWVKLIVGTLVVLALTIDNPAESLMQQMPVDQREPFITNIMWRNILGQALCQIMIFLIIQFKGESTFKLHAREKDTLIFNIFVLCQIFTIFNTVKGKNIFERLNTKRLFWMVIGIIILLQVIIVELLKRFADTERLNWKQWRACIGIAIIYWLIGCLLRRPSSNPVKFKEANLQGPGCIELLILEKTFDVPSQDRHNDFDGNLIKGIKKFVQAWVPTQVKNISLFRNTLTSVCGLLLV
ncbi:hypothetical protein Pfo_026296 [Paulownia fortunei]|nr:hypothetical protein Pfo_026296 [Paulownia fortunei]